MILNPNAKEKDFLVSIPPSSKPDAYRGICDDTQIKPVTTCGYWYPSPFSREDQGKKIVLHFHGGAFVVGDCRPYETANAAGTLTKHIGKTLMVSYRLSSNPNGRFPAALQDAVSAVHYLIDLGVDYSDIVISGDSAGGNLAVSLLRYLAESDTPAFSGALLWSPWVDLGVSLKPDLLYNSPHRFTDYLPPAFPLWGANAYCPKDAPVTMDSAWISPGPHPFSTKTPLWINGNGQEMLFEQIVKFADAMRGVEGNRVAFHNEDNATHDILLLAHVTGFEKELENSGRVAGEWLNGL